MRKFFLATITLFTLASTPVWASTYRAQSCSYGDMARNVYADGPCLMQDTKINGNFAFILIWPTATRQALTIFEPNLKLDPYRERMRTQLRIAQGRGNCGLHCTHEAGADRLHG
jgi:hypothetical protein